MLEEDIDETKDYYEILGLSSISSNEEIKAAYVKLALLTHPDTASKHFLPGQTADTLLNKEEENPSLRGCPGILKKSPAASGEVPVCH
jgi:DnaJ-domain-containing protein 1